MIWKYWLYRVLSMFFKREMEYSANPTLARKAYIKELHSTLIKLLKKHPLTSYTNEFVFVEDKNVLDDVLMIMAKQHRFGEWREITYLHFESVLFTLDKPPYVFKVNIKDETDMKAN